MALTDAQRSDQAVLIADLNIETLTNAPASATINKVFRLARAYTIERLDAIYQTEAGTTPALTVELRTSTTAILSAAVTTAATMVSDTEVETSQSLARDAGEELNIAFTSANADNDFTKVNVQVWGTVRYE